MRSAIPIIIIIQASIRTDRFEGGYCGLVQAAVRVDLDPDTEILPLLGSSEGLFHIHLCLLDIGDVALVPDPSYPSYEAGVKLAGGSRVEPVPLLRQNGFLPDLDAIPPEIARQAKLIWVNYPNNPTAAVATRSSIRS